MKKLTINQKVFDREVIKQKKFTAGAFKSQDKNLIGVTARMAKELALAYSGFKCEKCEATKKLTAHHLIYRYIKYYTDFWRYASQRYYWANVLILCTDCHAEIHNFDGDAKDKMEVFSDERIKKLKKKFMIMQ